MKITVRNLNNKGLAHIVTLVAVGVVVLGSAAFVGFRIHKANNDDEASAAGYYNVWGTKINSLGWVRACAIGSPTSGSRQVKFSVYKPADINVLVAVMPSVSGPLSGYTMPRGIWTTYTTTARPSSHKVAAGISSTTLTLNPNTLGPLQTMPSQAYTVRQLPNC